MAGLRLRWGPGGGMLKSIPAKGQGTASQGFGGHLGWAGRRVRNEAEGSVVSGVHSGLNCVP